MVLIQPRPSRGRPVRICTPAGRVAHLEQELRFAKADAEGNRRTASDAALTMTAVAKLRGIMSFDEVSRTYQFSDVDLRCALTPAEVRALGL